jgi:hypothetical protein
MDDKELAARIKQERAARAKVYLDDPLIRDFDKQMQESLYRALEAANERDTEHLKNLCLMAKQRQKFFAYLQSFISDEKVDDFNKQGGIIDSVVAFAKKYK